MGAPAEPFRAERGMSVSEGRTQRPAAFMPRGQPEKYYLNKLKEPGILPPTLVQVRDCFAFWRCFRLSSASK